MTQINLKKTEKYIWLGFDGLLVLFFGGDIQNLISGRLFGIPSIFTALIVAAILGILLYLWIRHMRNCQENGKKSVGLRFLETVHKYRFLIEQLVSRDFKIKYKRSVLGVFWSFLNPLLMMSVQYVVFSYLLNVRGDVPHYAVYLLCGIVIWSGFNDCVSQAMRSIIGNAPLITKVYVPKYIYPMTKVFSAFVNVLLSMIPLLLLTIVYGLFQTPVLMLTNAVLLLPFGLLMLLVFCMGMGFLLSSLMVFFHDVEFLWSVVSSIWMYATPIIYSLSMFEDKGADWFIKLEQANPMYHYIQFIRTVILEGTCPEPLEFLFCAGFAVIMFFVGFLVFKKTEDRFILYL